MGSAWVITLCTQLCVLERAPKFKVALFASPCCFLLQAVFPGSGSSHSGRGSSSCACGRPAWLFPAVQVLARSEWCLSMDIVQSVGLVASVWTCPPCHKQLLHSLNPQSFSVRDCYTPDCTNRPILPWIQFEKRWKKNYAGSEKLLPTLSMEKEPLWYPKVKRKEKKRKEKKRKEKKRLRW